MFFEKKYQKIITNTNAFVDAWTELEIFVSLLFFSVFREPTIIFYVVSERGKN